MYGSSRICLALGATAMLVGLVMPAAAGTRASPPRVTVTVFADTCVVGDRAFDDLRSLEHHVNALGARAVRVQACGSGATSRWMAVVHRFRHVPVEALVLDAQEGECARATPLALRVRDRAGKHDAEINDAEVDRYWQQLVP